MRRGRRGLPRRRRQEREAKAAVRRWLPSQFCLAMSRPWNTIVMVFHAA
jgi:hypothetical protein